MKSFETIIVPGVEGSEVTYCPERGGIITSLKLHGEEILYLDRQTLEDPTKNVRGGIPILFPNSGPIESTEFPDLAQHGFARNSADWTHAQHQYGFEEVLLSDVETKKVFPCDFRLSIKGTFQQDGSFTLTQQVENLEKEKSMPIAMGLHPYFRVPNSEKENIGFRFNGGQQIQEQLEVWANSTAISIDNPKIFDSSNKVEVFIPSLGTLQINASPEYRKIKVWSVPGKDFVCIEPVMRDDGGLIDDPEILGPGEVFSGTIRLYLGK